MEVSVQELYILLGQKEVENHLLRKRISVLNDELEQRDPVQEEVTDGV